MKKVLFYILLLFSLTFYPQSGKVVKVKDGDTVVVLDDTNVQHIIRVADVDCPEYKQPFSKTAKDFTSDEVYMKKVDIVSKGKDRYGRTIGYIMYDNGKNLSRELLKSGLAWHYVKYSSSLTFTYLENLARKMDRGLWVEKSPVEPWEWRKNKSK